jgi:putative FmdB family regulatory protein
MPIYAYRCESCGFAKDVLQKISDAPLTRCPECNKETFQKQVTAAGFQLKGSGWYVTDFRGGNGGKAAPAAANGAEGAGSGKSEGNADGNSGAASSGSTESASKSAAATSAASPAPAAAGSSGSA